MELDVALKELVKRSLQFSGLIQEQHASFTTKYKLCADRVESTWRAWDHDQRISCLKASATEATLGAKPDQVLESVIQGFIPGWNQHDLADESPDDLLNLLKYRAETSLFHQLIHGLNSTPGDHSFTIAQIGSLNVQKFIEESCNHYTIFVDCESDEDLLGGAIKGYAQHMQVQNLTDFRMSLNSKELDAAHMVCVINNVVKPGPNNSGSKARGPISLHAAISELSKCSIQSPTAALSIADLAANAGDQVEDLNVHLDFASIEANQVISTWVFEQRIIQCMIQGSGDRLLSDGCTAAIANLAENNFVVIHDAVRGVAMWTYLRDLFGLMDSSTCNKLHQSIILQEVVNICQLEYDRARGIVGRNLSAATCPQYFRYMEDLYDDVGNPQITVKINPKKLTRDDPQLHFLMQLCHPKTTLSQAVKWMAKLTELHKNHPSEQDKLYPADFDAIGVMAGIVQLIEDISKSAALPKPSIKRGRRFVPEAEGLVQNELKRFKLAWQNALNQGMPNNTSMPPGLRSTGEGRRYYRLVEPVRSGLWRLYEELIVSSLGRLEQQYVQAQAALQPGRPEQATSLLPSADAPLAPQVGQHRREKEKTRPSGPSTGATEHATEHAVEQEHVHDEDGDGEQSTTAEPIQVSGSTAEVFHILFGKAQARGSIPWVALEAAMAEVGFSILPKFGSVYTFSPTEGKAMRLNRSLTLHRPHKSRIEGEKLLMFAQRLKRVYGWGEGTFQTCSS